MRGRTAWLGMACGVVLLSLAAPQVTAEIIEAKAGTAQGVTRTYYIAADEVAWGYAPGQMDHTMGKGPDARAQVFLENGEDRLGKVYMKAVYREYTNGDFTTLKPRPASWEHLGILGPVLRGEVGDTLKVVFKNQTRYPFSMHPHGVVYDRDSEGMTGVPPGQTFVYTWQAGERSGPTPGGLSSVVWLYHSHVNEPRDVNSGAIGTIIISAKGTTRADGTPTDVDREFVTLFMIFNENTSWYIDHNIATYAADPKAINKLRAVPKLVDVDGEAIATGFTVSNVKFSMNGYLFGHMPGLTMKQGERVRWYLVALGNAEHTAHWHANVVADRGRYTDVVPLLSAQMDTRDMVADAVGTWMFHCHVSGHLQGGMYAHYTVEPRAPATLTSEVR